MLKKHYADIEKIKKMLGFNPKTNIEEGINHFIDWYLELCSKNNSN